MGFRFQDFRKKFSLRLCRGICHGSRLGCWQMARKTFAAAASLHACASASAPIQLRSNGDQTGTLVLSKALQSIAIIDGPKRGTIIPGSARCRTSSIPPARDQLLLRSCRQSSTVSQTTPLWWNNFRCVRQRYRWFVAGENWLGGWYRCVLLPDHSLP